MSLLRACVIKQHTQKHTYKINKNNWKQPNVIIILLTDEDVKLKVPVALPDAEVSEQEGSKSWSQLMVDFTQETTLHGIRYVTAESRYFISR